MAHVPMQSAPDRHGESQAATKEGKKISSLSIKPRAMHLYNRMRRLVGSVLAVAVALPLVSLTLPVTIAQAAAPTLVINEVNWAGSGSNPSDQWVELLNNTPAVIDFTVTPFSLFDGVNKITDLNTGTVAAGGFLLISHQASGGTSTLSNNPLLVQPMVVPTMLLSSTFQLMVKDVVSTVVDTAGNGLAPLAGTNTGTFASMARTSLIADGTVASSWTTPYSVGKGFTTGIVQFGTPGSANIEIVRPTSITVDPLPTVATPTVKGFATPTGTETAAALVVAQFQRISDGLLLSASAAPLPDTSFSITAPTLPNGLYRITVTTQDGAAIPDHSAPVTAVITGSPQNLYTVNPVASTPPAIPVLATFPILVNIPSVTLSGTVDATTTLVVSVNGSFYSSQLISGGSTAFSLAVTLLPNQLNKVEVRAQNAAGATSDPAVAQITHDNTAPTGLVTAKSHYRFGWVSGEAGSAEAAATVSFYTDAAHTQLLGSGVVKSDGSFDPIAVAVTKVIYATVTDAVGNSSAVVSVASESIPVLTLSTIKSDSLAISWQPVPDTVKYMVKYKTESGSFGSVTVLCGSGTCTYTTTITGLTASTKYVISLTGVNATGQESVATEVSGSTAAAAVVVTTVASSLGVGGATYNPNDNLGAKEVKPVTSTTKTVIPEPTVATPTPTATPAETGDVKSEETTNSTNWTPWIILAVLVGLALLATAGYFYWFGSEDGMTGSKSGGKIDQMAGKSDPGEVTTKITKKGSEKEKRW